MNTPRALRAVHLRKKHLKVAIRSPVVENVSLELKLLQTLQNTTGLILRHVTKNQQVYPNEREKRICINFCFSKINNLYCKHIIDHNSTKKERTTQQKPHSDFNSNPFVNALRSQLHSALSITSTWSQDCTISLNLQFTHNHELS